MKNLILLFSLIFSSVSYASLELIVFAHDNGGYPADALCFFSNTKMNVYGEGLIVHYTCLGKEDIYGEVWVVGPKGNKMIAQSQVGNLLTDAYLLDEKIHVLEFNEMKTVALFESDVLNTKKIDIPDEFSNAHIHSMTRRGDKMVFRYTNWESEHGEGTYQDGKFVKLPPRNVSYYHVAEANADISIQKLTRDKEEEIELRFAPDFAPITVLKDRDADPSSPFLYFANYLVLKGDRWAVMSKTDTGSVVILGKGKDYVVRDINAYSQNGDWWPGALSSKGDFIFRASRNGIRGLWVIKADGSEKLIFTSGREVKVGDYTVIVTEKSLFFNAPVINDDDEVYIGVGLGDKEDGPVMGQGIVKFKL